MWWRSLSGPAKTKTPTSLLVVVAVFGDPSILHGGFSYHQWISCSPFVGCLVVVFVILILLFDSDVYVLRYSAVLLSWCPHTRARIPFLPPPCSAVVVLAATHIYSPQYLGYILRPGNVSMDSKKIKTVRDWPLSKTVTELQELLGFINFYRRFIQEYLEIAT